MKLFKTIKRKVGNAVLPVVGTILALTILAGSVVAVALGSSKIVYKQNNLQKQNDARQILYLACKYFCEQKNPPNEKDDSVISAELKTIFGKGLKITKKAGTDSDTYYIWYPNSFKDSKQTEYDETKGNDQVKQWLKATIDMVEKKSNEEAGTEYTELSSTLFREAKIDELYNVGNLMSTYLISEGLLPSREYDFRYISLIEADIDTFDEVFKFVNNSGVIEIDDIAVALYGYQDYNDSTKINSVKVDKSDGKDGEDYYSIVYNLGYLGGNYDWDDDTGTTNFTRIYRQEYDAEFLVGMMEYYHPEYDLSYDNRISSTKYNTLSYRYEEETDAHYITAKGYYLDGEFYSDSHTITWSYASTIEFADAMADYVFWINIDRLALYLSDVKTAINNSAKRKFGQTVTRYDYKWTDDGLTVFTYGSSGYWDWPYTISEIDDFIVDCGYTDDGTTVSSQQVYDKLLSRTEIIKKVKYDTYSETIDGYNADDVRAVTNTAESFSVEPSTGYFPHYYYESVDNYYKNYYGTEGTASHGLNYVEAGNDFSQAVLDYLYQHLYDKYITGGEKLNGHDVDFMDDKDKLIASCHMVVNGNNVEISYHFNVLELIDENKNEYHYVRYNGTGRQRYVYSHVYRYDYRKYYSNDTGDTLILTVDQFKTVFKEDIIEWITQTDYVEVSEEVIEHQITVTRNEIKENLVDPIRYNYLPNTLLSQIVGGNGSEIGMKESTIALKLLTKYIEYNKDYFTSMKSLVITSTRIQDDSNYSGCFKYTINFKLNGTTPMSAVVYFKYLTNNARNTHDRNEEFEYITGELNDPANYKIELKEDGTEVRKMLYVPICDKDGETLNVADLNNYAICGVIPYVEEKDIYGNQINQKVTLNGEEYTVIGKNNISMLKNVDRNILYNGDIEDLGQRDFRIYIQTGKTLIINGKLNLLHNQTLELQDDAMILVNGDFLVFYEFNGRGNDDTDNYGARTVGSNKTIRAWDKDDYSYFKTRGVDIIAGDAKIMVNGNMTYRGYKARYTTRSQNSTLVDYYTGKNSGVKNFFDQTTFGIPENACKLNKSTNTYTHYPHHNNQADGECRSLLSGIYIINGDVKFDSWSPNAESNVSSNVKQVLYGNAYSNPLINATFYVDGTFNMQGLYMNSLYDPCRANFIFAKSIIQPHLALNAILTGGQTANAPEDMYAAWQNTNGFLFIIVEDAIDFSNARFGCVNLFTPYSQLLQQIEDNNQASENFSDFIDQKRFLDMYPDVSMTYSWGLSPILYQGLSQLYDPGDIGRITTEDTFNQNNKYGNEV